jgi:hypothetical protein
MSRRQQLHAQQQLLLVGKGKWVHQAKLGRIYIQRQQVKGVGLVNGHTWPSSLRLAQGKEWERQGPTPGTTTGVHCQKHNIWTGGCRYNEGEYLTNED